MNRRIRNLFLAMIISLSLGGAAWSYEITYHRLNAPEFDISYLARIAVLPFETTPGMEVEGKAIADRLSTHLAQEGILRLVERIQIDMILDDSPISEEDYDDPMKVADLGKTLGADAVVVGRVDIDYKETEGFTYVDEKSAPWELDRILRDSIKQSQTSYEINRKRINTLERSGDVTLVTKVVDVKTGRIIASKVANHSWQKRAVDDEEISKLPSKGEIIEDCISRCMDEVIRAFTPHKVKITRELRPRTGAKREESEAIKLAVHGYYEEAIDIFEEAIKKYPKRNDIRANLAILHEAIGDIGKADYWLHQAVLKDRTAHDLAEYRQSMLNSWYFVKQRSLEENPPIVLDFIDGRVYIDSGRKRGEEVGNKYRVCQETIIRHPITGDIMGRDTEPIGIVEIVEVQELMSIAEIVKIKNDEIKIKKLDVIMPLEPGDLEDDSQASETDESED